jgi:hypothetical protein
MANPSLARRASLRTLKRGGRTAEELWRNMRSSMLQAAREDGWRESELAAALTDLYMDMEIVFGKCVMKKADEAIK